MLRSSMIGATMVLALSVPANLPSCKEIQKAVDRYGPDVVISWALTHGYSEAQIIYLKRVCKVGLS